MATSRQQVPRAAPARSTRKRRDAVPAAARAARSAASSPPAAAGYHHGDLRNALLAATDALLLDAGLEGFTLREVARRAGVSHGAPAHHFGDVRGLLSAYTAEGFRKLAQAMAQRRAAAPGEAFEQLVASGVGYVDYALGHRAQFQLMFRSDRLDADCAPLADAGGEAFGHLTACIAALDPGADAEAEARRLRKTALAWSIVHGYATLMLDNRAFADHAQGQRARALQMVEAMVRSARPAFVSAPGG